MNDRQRVAVVTGGGGGIGAAIAESLGRTGTFVVTVDPLVSVDGSERLPEPEQTTAGRIVAAGGRARASGASVTDGAGVRQLFTELADEFGGLDAVVNVAGITRPTSFGKGSDDDWRDILSVHLDGYLNVLTAALPLMAAAGHGHILGVTSGSGWRAADAGAYGCAKRAVAALTWQLGRHAPPGVVVNAISPIAATRMVTAALGRAPVRAQGPAGSATGGLSLDAMPAPEDLGPLGAHLVGSSFAACRGRVLFAGGSEVAVVDEPRLLEVIRGDDVASAAHVLEAATTIALSGAEARQATGGGSNARFGGRFDAKPDAALPEPVIRRCAIATDRADFSATLGSALAARGVTVHVVASPAELAALDTPDAVVIALTGPAAAGAAGTEWERILAEHDGLAEKIHADATWTRAVADLARSADRALRLVTVTAAGSAGGRSRAQAAAQLARAGRRATGDLVTPFAVSAETDCLPTELVAHLVCSPAAADLAGAELVAGSGWFGLRSHPHPIGSISFGGPALPAWFDEVLTEMVAPQ